MKTNHTLRSTFSCLCFLFVLLLSSQHVFANKAVSSELRYIQTSDSTYLVHYQYSYHLSNQARADSIDLVYRAPGCHSGDTIRVALGPSVSHGYPFCGNRVNDPDSLETLNYTTIITLPAKCSEWIFSVTHLERSGENIASGHSFYTEARLNNLAASDNSSVNYSTSNNLFLEATRASIYSFNPFDVDGDSIRITLQQPQSGPQTSIPYQAGFSLQQPFPTIGAITLNPLTYALEFTADTIAIDKPYTLQTLTEEFRLINGTYQKIGSSTRNYYVLITPFMPIINENIRLYVNDSLIKPTDIANLNVCELNRMAIKIAPLDSLAPGRIIVPNFGPNVSVRHFNPPYNDSVTIEWIPDAVTNLNQPFYFNFSLNSFGCPLPGIRTITYQMQFVKQNQVAIVADSSILQPGQSKQLQAKNTGPDTLDTGQPAPYHYSWSPATGLSDPSIANPVASPNQTTRYTVYISSGTACLDPASVLVEVSTTSGLKENLQQNQRDHFILHAGQPFLEFEPEWQNSHLKIYDSSGKIVLEDAQYNNSWNGKQAKAGMYFYLLQHPKSGLRSGKIMLQK